jgi:hypothetical protein
MLGEPLPGGRRGAPPKGYRVVTVCLYVPEAEWLDDLTVSLQQAGHPKASRSLVVREAVLELQKALEGKSPREVLGNFAERRAGRTRS